MGRILVAIDPAAVRFAYAVGTPTKLLACGYATSAGQIPHLVPPRPPAAHTYHWLIELPKKYRGFGIAHNDLDRLRRTVFDLQRWAEDRGHTVEMIYPGLWKGNVPKHIHHQRLVRVLDPEELSLLPGTPNPAMDYAHDVYDAVGIYLFHAERTKRGGI